MVDSTDKYRSWPHYGEYDALLGKRTIAANGDWPVPVQDGSIHIKEVDCGPQHASKGLHATLRVLMLLGVRSRFQGSLAGY